MVEARFFLAKTVLISTRQKSTSHTHRTIVVVPEFITPIANYPPRLPPNELKSHKSPIASTPTLKPTPEGMLVPLGFIFIMGDLSSHHPPWLS